MNTNALALVAALDPERDSALTTADERRRVTLLAEVLATAAEESTLVRPAPSHRPPRRLVGIAAAAALVLGVATAGAVLTTRWGSLSATGSLSAASLASWTGTPTSIGSTRTASAAQAWCMTSTSGGGGTGPSTITNAGLRGQVASMVVRRGGYSFLCIVGSDAKGLWETIGDPATSPKPVGLDEIAVDSAGSLGDGASGLTYVEGPAGADVASVSITDSGKTFVATVEDGTWTAWWPTANPHGAITGHVTVTTTGGATKNYSGAQLQG